MNRIRIYINFVENFTHKRVFRSAVGKLITSLLYHLRFCIRWMFGDDRSQASVENKHIHHMEKKVINLFFRQMLLLLFISYYSSITMFFHIHMQHGQVYVHSHFFLHSEGKQPDTAHSHSHNEYNLIHELNEIYTDAVCLFTPPFNAFAPHYSTLYCKLHLFAFSLTRPLQLLRGPPSTAFTA